MAPHSPQLSEEIVLEVADATNQSPLELPPLYQALDPDALDALLGTLSDGVVRFQYDGSTVRVDSRGRVRVDPIEAQRGGPAGGEPEVAEE